MPLRHALSFAIGLSIIMFLGGIYIGVGYSDRVAPVASEAPKTSEAPAESSVFEELNNLKNEGWDFQIETWMHEPGQYLCWISYDKDGADITFRQYGDNLKDVISECIRKARLFGTNHEGLMGEEEKDVQNP